jgi:hypothetical protein
MKDSVMIEQQKFDNIIYWKGNILKPKAEYFSITDGKEYILFDNFLN